MFLHLATISGADEGYFSGVADIEVVETSGGTVLWMTTRGYDGGLAAYAVLPDGSLLLQDVEPLSDGASAGIEPQIQRIVVEGTEYAVVTGAGGEVLSAFSVAADGSFLGAASVTFLAPQTMAFSSTDFVDGTSGSFLVTLSSGSTSPTVWSISEPSPGEVQLTQTDPGSNVFGTSAAASGYLTQLATLQIGSQAIVLAAGTGDANLRSYRLLSDGTLVIAQIELAEDGPGIADPSAIRTATVAGETFAIIAGSTSGSLSAYRIAPDGSFTITDHVTDDLTTRFGGTSALELITVNDRVFIVAAGNDQGLSVFELLPTGLLHLHGSIEDNVDMALTGITAIGLSVAAGNLQITVTGSGTEGMTRLEMSTAEFTSPIAGSTLADVLNGSAADDLLFGDDGDDTLYGNAGGDILLDGHGSDVLFGGSGADTFVFVPDGQADDIRDFNKSEDVIDLSHWVFLRNPDQLEYAETANGGVVTFAGEMLTITTVDASTLTQAEFVGVVRIGPAHFLPSWTGSEPPSTDPTLYGTSGTDTLSGTSSSEIIIALESDDTITALGGYDLIYGGAGNDTINGNGNGDTVYGGDGQDVIDGGIGWDHLYGEAGNDTIYGKDGYDIIYGGGGDDFIEGNFGLDTVFGGDGDDHINGGLGFDTLYGDAGSDTIYGMDGYDVIDGGAGNDVLFGNNGFDTIYGGIGDDTLDGGFSPDTLFGGDGNDWIAGQTGADDLFGGNGHDTLFGSGGNDILHGDAGDDSLFGGSALDTLFGGEGRDNLYGGNADDHLSGGVGDDTLNGEGGDDSLVGGAGADIFVYASGADVVTDFEPGIDRIFFDAILWGGSALTGAQLIAYASTEGTHVNFNFGAGNVLTLLNLDDPAILVNDIFTL